METIDADIVRAARGMADLNQEELARAAGIAASTVIAIEGGTSNPTPKTTAALLSAFENAGIEIRNGAVRKADDTVRIITGSDAYVQLLDNIYSELLHAPDAELLIFFGDDKISTDEVNRRYRKLRNAGIRMRQLVEEGNTYLMGALSEYRTVPSAHFINNVQVVYGNKAALVIKRGQKRILVIHDQEFAAQQRGQFAFFWAQGKIPEHSDADQVF